MLRPIPENFGLPKHGGPSCCLASGKKGIRPCQGLTIWTSFYLLLLLSNSKKKLPPQYPHNLTFASPHPVCFISRPASTSNYLEYYIWGKPPREDPVAARQISVSGKKTGSGTDFRILSRLALWIIISVINFPSSPTILIGDSPPTLWPRSTEVTNVFPWKQTCHAIVTAGLSNEIQLCQRRTSWWPDWSRISATVWLLTTAMLLNCVRALAVIVRHMHKTVSFGLFVSRPLFFPALSLSLSHHTSFSFFFFPSYGLSSTKAQHTAVWWHRPVEIQGVKKTPFSILFDQKALEIWKWLCTHGSKSSENSQWSEESGTRLWHRDKSLTLLEIV